MNPVRPTREEASQLGGIDKPVVLGDPSGQVRGTYFPNTKRMPTNLCPFSPEEIAEMLNSGDEGCSLEEIWRRLGVR